MTHIVEGGEGHITCVIMTHTYENRYVTHPLVFIFDSHDKNNFIPARRDPEVGCKLFM